MFHTVLSHEIFKRFITEMRTSIANNVLWDLEPRKDVCFQEFKHHSVVISFAGDCFNLFGHIVHPHQYVRVTIGCRERSHEIDAPNIEKLDY